MVGVTGMSVQRDRMREILVGAEGSRASSRSSAGRGSRVAEGWDRYDGLIDVIFVGEAEETWPQFLSDWERGEHRDALRAGGEDRHDQGPAAALRPGPVPRVRDGVHPDLARLPVPVRVLRHHRHLRPTAAGQDARAGRRRGRRPVPPGARLIFLVDDNFIGNKKAAKGILRALIDWQRQHGYPLAFSTEASLDLAEDDELIELMAEAGLVVVFVGIESPDEESLRETKKYQNVRGA